MYTFSLLLIQLLLVLALIMQACNLWPHRRLLFSSFYLLLMLATLALFSLASLTHASIYQLLFLAALLAAEGILFLQSRSSFHRLQWRLALSYILLTAFSLMAGIALLTGVASLAAPASLRTPSFVSSLLAALPTVLPIVIFSSMLGTLFGFLTARGMLERLARLTQAARSWSQGAFQVTVYDPSQDELGQLARDFNAMAAQLQEVLVTRQRVAVLEERQRVARDLHDAVKQDIFSLALLLGAARTLLPQDLPRVEEYLAEAEQLALQTRGELTTIIQELHPPSLTEKGFLAVTQHYIEHWSTRTGIRAEATLLQSCPSLSPTFEQNLLRVLQEALANVARHSHATCVWVTLKLSEQQLCLLIQDNGRGFDVAADSCKGFGLTTMRERIKALHGQLDLVSAPGETSVFARVPLSSSLPKG